MFGFFRKKKKKQEEEEHSLIERDAAQPKSEEQIKEEQRRLGDQIALGANAQNLDRYSSAAQEFVKGYTGYDASTGQQMVKSLKSISQQKLNPDYYETNVRQQAGFTAEVFDVSRKNAQAKLNGDNIRYSRVDDVAGRPINETAYDITAFDASGNEILSEAAQMKFLKYEKTGGTYSVDTGKLAQTLTSKQFREKYPHGSYVVPKDAYEGVKEQFQQKEASLQRQLARARQQNDAVLERELNEKLEYVQKADRNLKCSEVRANEAIQARLHPEKMTAKEIATYGHEAGVQYAKGAATITGAITFGRCAGKVINGEMTPEEAAKEVALESAKSAGRGYLTGQANTAVGAMFRNSSKEFLRNLGKSNAPAMLVSFTGSAFQIMNDYFDGRISDKECFNSLAKSGVGVVGTFKAGALGQAIGEGMGFALGGPVGAIVASTVAGVAINAVYDYAVQQLEAPGLAHQERLRIEAECNEIHREMEHYRTVFRENYIKNTEEMKQIFGNSIRTMCIAMDMDDADAFIGGANTITKSLGGKVQFNNVDEFEDFLDSDDAFDL